jgi:hypothetical protein
VAARVDLFFRTVIETSKSRVLRRPVESGAPIRIASVEKAILRAANPAMNFIERF